MSERLRRVLRSDEVAIALAFLALKGLLLAWGASAYPDGPWTRAWRMWDAAHYRAIAVHGYASSDLAPDRRDFTIHFPPLYPALMRVGMATGLEPATAGIVLSIACSLLATLSLYRLARSEFDRGAGLRSAALFALYPTAYFGNAPYAEGLYLLLVVLFFHALRRWHRPWLAAGLASAATLTRLLGVSLLAALLWGAKREDRPCEGLFRRLSVLALGALGAVTYLALNLYYYGDPFFFLWDLSERSHAIQVGQFPLRFTWVGVSRLATDLSAWGDAFFMNFVGWNAIFVVFALLVTAAGARRVPGVYTAYAVVALAMISNLSWAISNARYTYSILPLFLVLGRPSNPWLFAGLALAFGAGQLYFAGRFLSGAWAF